MRYIEKNTSSNSLVVEAKGLLKLAKHYNENDRVRDIIRLLYSNCCAYCECSPEDGSFFQIEHFYPKNISKYKKYAKSIENLHYSCQRCNSLKGKKLYINILSPNYYLISDKWQETRIDKIENELYYVGHLLFSSNNTPSSTDRGSETIKLFDLNNNNGAIRSSRQHLIESRLRVYENCHNILDVIYELLLNYDKKNNKAIELLFRIFIKNTNRTSHFSIMVIHNFGSYFTKLLKIYIRIKTL